MKINDNGIIREMTEAEVEEHNRTAQEFENTYGLRPIQLEQVIAEPPTEEGTYVLKATVSDGVATYQWEIQA